MNTFVQGLRSIQYGITHRFISLGLGLIALTLMPQIAYAQQSLAGVSIFSNGSCSALSPTLLQSTITSVPTQFTTTDEVIDFGGGVTQTQDVVIFYVTDAANVVIGRYAEGFPTTTDLANGFFFRTVCIAHSLFGFRSSIKSSGRRKNRGARWTAL